MQRALATILIFGGLCWTIPAAAQRNKVGVLVLKLEADGLPKELAGKLDEAVRNGVRRAKKKLLPAPALDFSGMQMAAGCLDDGPDCLLAMGRPLSAGVVIRVAMSGTQAQATFNFTVVGIKKGRTQTYEAKLTDVDASSTEELTWHTMTMLGAKPAPLSGGIDLLMTSSIGSLDGAEYFLDDKKVPRSALERVPAGSHRLEVHQRGFETFIWMGEVKRGRTEQVRVELKPKGALAYNPPPPPPPSINPPPSIEPPPSVEPPPSIEPPPSADPPVSVTTTRDGPRFVYSWVLGAAAVVAGGIGLTFNLIGYNAQNRLNDFYDSDKDRFGRCQNAAPLPEESCADYDSDVSRTKTGTIGARAGYFTGGALAIATIVVFIWEFNASPEPQTDVAFSVAPIPGGGAASFALEF